MVTKLKTLFPIFDDEGHDQFTKITFLYDHAVASATVAKGVKSEGELIVSGSKGYIYVPAPWWKTDYLRFDMKKRHRTNDIFINWMVKASVMNLLLLQEQ